MEETPDELGKHLILIAQLSCVDGMLQMADEVLSLAAEHPKQAEALAASATVILTAALEQGVTDWLFVFARSYAIAYEVYPSDTPYRELLEGSLRRRIVELPKIRSDGNFRLKSPQPLRTEAS